MGVLTLPRAKPMLLFPQYDLPCHAKSSAFRHKAFGVQRHPQRRKTSIGCESKNKKERNGKNQEKSGTAAKNSQNIRKKPRKANNLPKIPKRIISLKDTHHIGKIETRRLRFRKS